jgi:TolB-like protein/DNA-binding winged helix-turn-helix (wHTH) protein
MTMPANEPSSCYQFGDLTLDVAQRRVARRGCAIELSALNFDLLRTLVESAPAIVGHDELAEKAWGRHFVSPENIAQRIMLLRQALSDDANRPRYVEVVRGKGYRLIPSVRALPAEDSDTNRRRWLIVTAAAVAVAVGLVATDLYRPDATRVESADALGRAMLPNSVAVLPLRDLSPDPENAYFAAGIHEEIIGQLARIPNINVIAQTSVQRYASDERPIGEIARELNVEMVMEGSVRYADGRVRVNTNLIDAATDTSRWSQTYERELGDVFAVQEDIALNIATALGQELSPTQQLALRGQATTSPEAAALYLRVVDLRRSNSFDSATQHRLLDQALGFDPDFADAYALKAAVYAISVVDRANGWADDVDSAALRELALANANKALQLDPRSSVAYLAIAVVHRFFWHWSDSLSAIVKANELSPNDIDAIDAHAGTLSWHGDHENAIRLARRVRQLDPTSPAWRFGIILAQAGRADEAVEVFREAAAMAPALALIHHWLGIVEGVRGNRADARAELHTAEQLSASGFNPTLLTGLMYSYSRIDSTDDVARLFAELERMSDAGLVGPGTWALAYLARGDLEQALRWLRAAVERIENHEPAPGFLNLMTIKTNVHANPVLDEPRFQELRDRIGTLD